MAADTGAAVWTGGCLCGHVRYRTTGTPLRPHYCHCRMCQQATGGPFAALVGFDRGSFEWTGAEPKRYRSSSLAQRGFCGECGTPLTYEREGAAHVSVTIPSLDRPDAIPPQAHWGVESRLSWPKIDDGLPGERTEDVAPSTPS
ncbi:GFA family protein [Thalassobaculum sp. OXR-137]|uniref:GFA family protein n=1 Tax=Thalassobaculum sp. OXR-137 TaxID=3100173 RepID=UPI002AC99B14|nr:GFA family protein [Thalassobaculum sp. OXR-137]WPZ35697.1 GFA family protein [Thalassobaculum sp. OXR-137]